MVIKRACAKVSVQSDLFFWKSSPQLLPIADTACLSAIHTSVPVRHEMKFSTVTIIERAGSTACDKMQWLQRVIAFKKCLRFFDMPSFQSDESAVLFIVILFLIADNGPFLIVAVNIYFIPAHTAGASTVAINSKHPFAMRTAYTYLNECHCHSSNDQSGMALTADSFLSLSKHLILLQ